MDFKVIARVLVPLLAFLCGQLAAGAGEPDAGAAEETGSVVESDESETEEEAPCTGAGAGLGNGEPPYACSDEERWDLFSRQCPGGEDCAFLADDRIPEMAVRAQPELEIARRDLNLLVSGRPPEQSDLAGLLETDPGHLGSVREALEILPEQIEQMERVLADLGEKIGDPESLVLPVERPGILDEELEEPIPPEEPAAPSPPEVKRPRKGAKPRTARAKEAAALWSEYDEAQANHAAKMEEYRAALEAYEEEKAAWEALVRKREEASRDYRRAVRQRAAEIDLKLHQLRMEEAGARVRLENARLRHRYLGALSRMLERMPGPARETFRGLNQPKSGLRGRAATLGRLAVALGVLKGACAKLHARAVAGSLVGFQGQREELAASLEGDLAEIEDIGARLAEREAKLTELAQELEREGHETRGEILVLATSPRRQERIDAAFEEHLRISRTMDRSSLSSAIGDMEIDALATEIAGSLKTPEAISSVADSEHAMGKVRRNLDRARAVADSIRSSIERHRHAFERELVTVFSPLASDGAKERAFSFSAALLDDILADFNMLRVNLGDWAARRIDDFAGIPQQIGARSGVIRMARVVGGIVLVLVLLVSRKRLRRTATRAILRINNLPFFRRRAGVLVRLTVFLLALLPTGLLACAGYLLLFLVGFDHPETRFVEVAFRWIVFYLLGRQAVIGLTKTESAGRPPIFEVSSSTADLLRRTYGRLGFVLAVAAMADEWSRQWLGTGSLTTVLRLAALVWTGGWLLWAMGAWRQVLASSCAARTTDGSLPNRLAVFGERHFIGIVLSPIYFVWLMPLALVSGMRKLAAEGGLLSYLRAKSLRRRARKSMILDEEGMSGELPEEYTRQFPLYPLEGEEGEVLLPRDRQLKEALDQIARWARTGQDGSLVITGEKGIGKTTFLALMARRVEGVPVERAYLSRRVRTEEALIRELSREFELDGIKTIGEIARYLNDGPRRVVLLDEAHNIFLRTVDGFEAVDTLIRLVDVTSENVMWVLAFNTYSWRFLRRTNRHVRALRRTVSLPSWSREELQELIVKRNDRSGLEVRFDEILLDAEASSTGGFELVSSAEGFFRLLWEASNGNPRVATYIWLKALTRVDEDTLEVGLIKEEDATVLARLDDDVLYALASIVQHENLSFDELRQSLNTSLDEAGHAARFLMEYGFLEHKHNDSRRITLAPRYHQQVLRALTERHLLLKEDVS